MTQKKIQLQQTIHQILFWFLLLATSRAYAADVNVLIVGTTDDSGEYHPDDSSTAFDTSKVRNELENILSGANMGTIQVSLHDFSDNSYYGIGNQLISEFYSQNRNYQPVSSGFWSLLRSTDWDYVILMGEPNKIEYFPGVYTLGVSEIGKEVNGETVLFMGWPGETSESSVEHYKEVVYRTGRSIGYKVVPAGLAWRAQGSVHGSSHPTDDGAYIAAAAIYSRLWGVEDDKTAADSSYAYNDALANDVHEVVKANMRKAQYSGPFLNSSGIFSMMGDHRREWVMGSIGSSTENTLRQRTEAAGREAGMDVGGKEANSGPKGIYVARQNKGCQRGFNMNTIFFHPAAVSGDGTAFINAIDWFMSNGLRNSRDILATCGIYRHIPHPVLWAAVNKELPDAPFIEYQHGGRAWALSAASFMITLMSGRCPMSVNRSRKSVEAVALKVGYETAWRMSTLQGRAPGFKAMPSNFRRHEVDPRAPETMTVRFMFPPTQIVTVFVSTNAAWATVSPETLTFTPENYNTPQEVTVALTAEAASRRGERFNVLYYTTSNDEVCNDLADSWEYGVNTLPVAENQSALVLANDDKNIRLNSFDPDIVSKVEYRKTSNVFKQVMTYSLVEGSHPQHGKVVIDGNVAVYTPDPGFVGSDRFMYAVFDGLAYSTQNGTVDITVFAEGQYDINLITNPGAEFMLDGWKGSWESFRNKPGNFAQANAHTGVRSFKVDGNNAELYQDVNLSDYSAAINANKQSFHFSGYGSDLQKDDCRLALQFRDANGTILGTPYESDRVNSREWKLIETTLQAPANAVVARVIMRATKLRGKRTYAYVDSLSLTAIRPQNSAPVAIDPPQASVVMDVPTTIALAATDIDRHPSDKLTFEIVTAPRRGEISGWVGDKPVYTPNTSFLGEDVFTFRVFDGQLYSANTGTAKILVRANEPPRISVHTPATDHVYMAATNGLILETTITDDGGPAVPGTLSVAWEQLDGPNQAIFSNPNAENTTCNWGDMNPGTYKLRVTASDGEYETVSDFVVEVLVTGYDDPGNIAPQVDVGGPYGEVNVGQALTLNGASLSDDGGPNETIVEWLQVSGPELGVATFTQPSKYTTDVVFSAAGDYVLRLTADDGEVRSYEDVAISATAWSYGETITVFVSSRTP